MTIQQLQAFVDTSPDLRQLMNAVVDFIQANPGGGTVEISATSYANNADAVAALGVGKLYKSVTLINDSPVILLTV